MTREDFKAHVNQLLPPEKRVSAITDKEWAVVEKVYTFHPAISETDGKSQIAYLYVRFGYSVIADMYQRAGIIEAKERRRSELKAAIDTLSEDIEALRKGEWVSGDC